MSSRTAPKDYLKKLQESLLERVQSVLKSKGGHTEYWLSISLILYKLFLLPYKLYFYTLRFKQLQICSVNLQV